MPVPRGIYLLMPTLEEAFPTVSEALVEQFGRSNAPAEGQEQHDPFEGMIAVLLDRELGGIPRRRRTSVTRRRWVACT